LLQLSGWALTVILLAASGVLLFCVSITHRSM
jgi:hypothetical protein